ncbi:hypothetical protein Psfp_04283 [Pelotomaculum sp. FP]|nr:hypothetical protein Psfp_04283 [Pelotomaculum sp. FP]
MNLFYDLFGTLQIFYPVFGFLQFKTHSLDFRNILVNRNYPDDMVAIANRDRTYYNHISFPGPVFDIFNGIAITQNFQTQGVGEKLCNIGADNLHTVNAVKLL